MAKCLRINLTTAVKDLCNENYKSLMREIEAVSQKCKNITCSRLRKLSITERCILPKAVYKSITLSTKTNHIFSRTRKNTNKICTKS